MSKNKIIKVPFNDMNGIYVIAEDGTIGFSIVPNNKEDLFFDKGNVDPLVQISCTGDSSCPGFCAGETRHNSGLTMAMKYVSQDIEESKDLKTVTTTVKSENGLLARHVVLHHPASRSNNEGRWR